MEKIRRWTEQSEMKYNPIPARDVLLAHFYYRPDTGKLYRRGTDIEAGCIQKCHSGLLYRRVKLNGKKYLAHRIIWVIIHGSLAEDIQVDHEDGDGLNNRPRNLRKVSNAVQHKNRRRRNDNSSGCTGVSWREKTKRWLVKITVDGNQKHIGCFESFDDAVKARKQAEIQLMFHPNHDRTVKESV
jgi:hypothetical protein